MGTQVSLAVQRRILARRDVYFLDEYTLLSWDLIKCFESTTINLVESWAALFLFKKKRIFGLPPHASPESTRCKIRCRILVIGQRGGGGGGGGGAAQQKESQNRQPTVLTWAAPTLPKLVHMCNRCLKYTFRQGVNNKPESGSGLQYI
jgi:hypothetical protein